MTAPDDSYLGHAKPFLEHLDDLRRCVLWCGVFLLVGMGVAIPLAPWIMGLLVAPLAAPLAEVNLKPDEFLKVLQVTGGLATAMRLVLWSGCILAAPAILGAVGRFVFPGLTRRERRVTRVAAAAGSGLFAAGIWMAYALTLPVAMRVMLRICGWLGVSCEFVELGDYISFALRMLLAFGIAFELPLLVLVLGALGIVTSTQLREKRRHVIVGLLVVAMILTPPDPGTQLLMAVPMAVLYELCIWLVWLRERQARIRPPSMDESRRSSV